MEYDVLLPMASVFDVPMLSDDLQEVKRLEAARRNEQPLLTRHFAVDRSLGGDPCHCGKALKSMRRSETGRSNNEDRSPFVPAVTVFPCLGSAAARASLFEQGDNVGM